MPTNFDARLANLKTRHQNLIHRPNQIHPDWDNGVFERYRHPVVTAEHTPLAWRYDLNRDTNPHCMERLPMNAAFNAGAMYRDGKVLMILRMEGSDRKSFFAIAESKTGTDGFEFWDEPLVMPETDRPDVNVYDMRLTEHED
ncbi:MAG: glycosidase, partial [Planctomycetota bacterium]